MVFLAFIDDGHGIETPGKRTPYIAELGRSIKENEFNAPVAKMIYEELKRHGVHAYLTAPTNKDVPLKDRTDYANKVYREHVKKYGKENVKAIFVSVHYNAFDGSFGGYNPEGISVHIYPGHRHKDAGKLAECILNELKEGTDQKVRGIKEDNFHVLRETAMPAALTENGFMDNKKEALLMLDKDFQKEVALEHTKGILNYFGLEFKKEKKDVLYKVQVGAFSNYDNAKQTAKRLREKGFPTYIIKQDE